MKLKLDLAKNLYPIIMEAMKLVNNNEVLNFVMADINCCLKVVFKDGKYFFSDCDNVRDILNKEGID